MSLYVSQITHLGIAPVTDLSKDRLTVGIAVFIAEGIGRFIGHALLFGGAKDYFVVWIVLINKALQIQGGPKIISAQGLQTGRFGPVRNRGIPFPSEIEQDSAHGSRHMIKSSAEGDDK